MPRCKPDICRDVSLICTRGCCLGLLSFGWRQSFRFSYLAKTASLQCHRHMFTHMSKHMSYHTSKRMSKYMPNANTHLDTRPLSEHMFKHICVPYINACLNIRLYTCLNTHGPRCGQCLPPLLSPAHRPPTRRATRHIRCASAARPGCYVRLRSSDDACV